MFDQGWVAIGGRKYTASFLRFRRARSTRCSSNFRSHLFARASMYIFFFFFTFFYFCLCCRLSSSARPWTRQWALTWFRIAFSFLSFRSVRGEKDWNENRKCSWLTITSDLVVNVDSIGRHCHERGSTSRTRSRFFLLHRMYVCARTYIHICISLYIDTLLKLYCNSRYLSSAISSSCCGRRTNGNKDRVVKMFFLFYFCFLLFIRVTKNLYRFFFFFWNIMCTRKKRNHSSEPKLYCLLRCGVTSMRVFVLSRNALFQHTFVFFFFFFSLSIIFDFLLLVLTSHVLFTIPFFYLSVLAVTLFALL